MASMQEALRLPYARFIDAQKQLADIVAIDYFFARQFSQLLLGQSAGKASSAEIDVIFHCLLALNVSLRAGHSCLPIESIANQRFAFASDENDVVTSQGFIFGDSAQIAESLARLAIAPEDQQAIVYVNQRLYLRRYYLFEQVVSDYLAEQLAAKPLYDSSQYQQLAACIDAVFPHDATQINTDIDWQKVAVANALNKRFSVIAGGPGTGKTYTVTKLLAALLFLHSDSELAMALVAPTGKAAQRLSESITNAVAGFAQLLPAELLAKIPTESQTIHRLLGVLPNSPNFKFNQQNKLDLDVLLVDEVSMVDLPLMSRLLSAIPAHCRVILLGDAQQLPSVAAGSVLADITPNKQTSFSKANRQFLSQVAQLSNLPKVKEQITDYLTYLVHSRRFDGQGGIGLLATEVIKGEGENSWQLLEQSAQNLVPQLYWQAEEINWLNALVEQYYLPLNQAQDLEQAFMLLSKFRVLTPTRKGETGVEQLNLMIEQQIMQQAQLTTSRVDGADSKHFYHGKPIMISENDYHLGLYNGDIGLLWRESSGHLMAVFEQKAGEFIAILPSRLPQFETVYAMTIHKTQGSEFEHVAMILPKELDNQLLSRELLYTGITRAKQQLTIACNKAAWLQGVERQVLRYSGLNIKKEKN